MTDGQMDIPIGPIVGAAVGLGILAATAKITRDALDNAKSREQLREQPTRTQPLNPHQLRPHPIARKDPGFDIDARINKMLGR